MRKTITAVAMSAVLGLAGVTATGTAASAAPGVVHTCPSVVKTVVKTKPTVVKTKKRVVKTKKRVVKTKHVKRVVRRR